MHFWRTYVKVYVKKGNSTQCGKQRIWWWKRNSVNVCVNLRIPVLACTISTKKISKLDFFNSNFFIDFGNIFSSVVRVRNISKKYMIHDCEIGFYLIFVICIYQQFNCWFFLLLNKYFRNTRPHLKMLVFFSLKKRLRKCRKKVRKIVKIMINVTDLIALNFKTKFPGLMNCFWFMI